MEQSADHIQQFYKMVEQFQLLEALDRYYEEEIISWENDGKAIKGLTELRLATEQFVKRVKDPKVTLKSSIMLNGVSLAKWHYQFNHEELGELDYHQISIGYWKGNKLIKEHHLY